MDTVALTALTVFRFALTAYEGSKPAWIKGCSPILHLPSLPSLLKHANPSWQAVSAGHLQGTSWGLGLHG